MTGVALSEADDWRPFPLFVLLLVLANVSEAFRLKAKLKQFICRLWARLTARKS